MYSTHSPSLHVDFVFFSLIVLFLVPWSWIFLCFFFFVFSFFSSSFPVRIPLFFSKTIERNTNFIVSLYFCLKKVHRDQHKESRTTSRVCVFNRKRKDRKKKEKTHTYNSNCILITFNKEIVCLFVFSHDDYRMMSSSALFSFFYSFYSNVFHKETIHT